MARPIPAVVAAGIILLCSCGPSLPESQSTIRLKHPSWFPEPVIPSDNELQPSRIALGKKLFYDNRLSSDGTTSCATCHVASAAFTDGRVTSTGAHERAGKRNAPTLANLAWMPYFMMEGGVPSLEMQSMAPMHDTSEMDLGIVGLIRKFEHDDDLQDMAQQAYGRSLDAFVLVRSLAAFERTLVSGDSRYDRLVFQENATDWTDDERKGMALFFSERTNCSGCHSGVFFSDFDFHNIGLYADYSDHGRERVSYKPEDIGKFKTPMLRNIELTAPYMHDGSIQTLEDVIAFYNDGGKGHLNQDPRIHPLHLEPDEQKQLRAFLNTLTDWNFVQNKRYLPDL